MKTLVIFYSYSGNTRKIARGISEKEDCDLLELKDAKKRSAIGTFIMGSYAAMKRRKTELEDFNSNFSSYNRFIILMPIWAGHPAPPINNIVELLPTGCEAELIMVSGGGSSSGSSHATIALFENRGIKITAYKDIKA